MDRTWGPPFPAIGPAPIGELETRCPGCRCRFHAGQLAMQRFEGPFPIGLWAHIACTDSVEALEQAAS